MSTFKRVAGDYTIQSVNTGDKIIINSGNVYIEGNLWVTGNTQTITSTVSELSNSVIVLNSGASVPNPGGANITVDRGAGGANVGLSWNETLQVWQVSNDGRNWANISTYANLYADTGPTLSANLDLHSHSIWDSTVTAGTASNITLGNVSGGGSGVYATTNATAVPEELITKSKALAYSIIFG
jgi:hypothetical protein